MKSRESKLPVPTAKEINEAHRAARLDAESAVKNAIHCGQLLIAKKDDLHHGDFQQWVDKHCEFAYSTGARYMTAAKKSLQGVEISSLSALFPSGKPKPPAVRQETQAPTVKEPSPQKAASVVENNPEPPEPSLPPEALDAWVPDEDEDEQLALAEKHLAEVIDKVMASDDRLSTAHAEIKRLATENAVLRFSRDGYMNGKQVVSRMLKSEQRKVDRLSKDLSAARDEIEALRERVSIMEVA